MEPVAKAGSIVMGDHESDGSSSTLEVRPFPSTHWSVVLAAGTASEDAEQALAEVCRKYWWPLYAYVRRRGYGRQDAEDLTQEFLARFIEKRYLSLADPRRGRFRSFFLTALEHFLSDQWDRAKTEKRGGGLRVFSLDADDASRWMEPADDLTPEKAYEQCWGEALLDAVLVRLADEYAANGKQQQFDLLKRYLWGSDGSITYAQIAAQLSMTEAAVKTAVHRLRQRYALLLRHEISQTVTSREELEDELAWLRATFA
jgi:RNA polymerase sigma factor (sigma-70 family)